MLYIVYDYFFWIIVNIIGIIGIFNLYIGIEKEMKRKVVEFVVYLK